MGSQQSYRTGLWNWLRRVLDSLLRQDPTEFPINLLRTRHPFSRLWNRVHYHAIYEILDYDSTQETLDPKGEKAVLTRRHVIRFLQGHVVAIHDHARDFLR